MGDFRDDGGRSREDREIDGLMERLRGLKTARIEAEKSAKAGWDRALALELALDESRAELRDCDGERIRLLAEIGGYMRANAELERRVLDRDDLVHSLRTMVELGSAMIDAQETTIDILKEALADLKRGATGETMTNLSESLARLGAVVNTLPTAIDGLAAMRRSS